mmetsp:Transcript_19033/g.46742  ORF Transcript_19033/g.46742 Transcript_19033/m.46742 type:complete len:552 (+) Transcript_19033:167-1822(+)|eukprot:CAMPEP_0114518808 /NCGR_PEP_ID=MMETSP0109-20121206/18642_1 /TAXON_ID=29199 /ORGANISM="Chlorarachnion reptans, Strain CCCM449" /LENGTH=551 /DNA_ID=CAMNT_0001699455 /DNA_START=115 /DNA_END=1770 /DNA_ORIENTATION=-
MADPDLSPNAELARLRKRMKKARKKWREDKENLKLKKAFRKAKKALQAAKESAAAPPAADQKSAGKKKRKLDPEGGGKSKTPKSKKAKAIPTEKRKKMAKKAGKSAESASKTSDADIKEFREEHKVTVKNCSETHRPFLRFDDLNYPDRYLSCVKGFKRPTPIQAEAWPLVMAGKDVIGIAATGSGKTLGFTLPCLPRLEKVKIGKKDRGPLMLVLSPTRELAQQTHRVCEQVSESCDIKSVCIIGGGDKRSMIPALRAGMHIVVATPGRLLGFIREGELDLSKVCYAVLDEADRMLDEGFERDIRKIMSMVRKDRQTLLFSATWPQEVQKLGLEFVKKDAAIITIGDRQNKLIANKRVTQTIEVLEDSQRDYRLHQLLQKYHNGKNRVIIFCLYKKEAARVEKLLLRKRWNAISIHGDKSQAERSKALQQFKDGSIPLLVATDVAARGLDVKGVEAVLNYAFPLTVEDYVHRIGRTGRAGESGISHTFFTKANKSLSGELIQVLNQAEAPVPKELLAFGTGTKRKKHPLYGDHFRASDGPMPKSKHITFN